MTAQTLFFLAFASQIVLISIVFPRTIVSRMTYILENFPPSTHPRLYPRPVEHYEGKRSTYRTINYVIVAIGIAAFAALATMDYERKLYGNASFFYFLLQFALPKMSAVAISTAKSEISQPLFLINLLIGIFLLLLFIWIPYNTFGEDIKVLKDSGMTLIMVLCIIQAVWAASSSVADEIEGRTALTVLSKPIARWQFILGKYAGICWAVAVMFVILGAIFLIIQINEYATPPAG